MKSKRTRIGLLSLLLSTLLIPGCTGSDALNTGTEQLTMVIEGRNNTGRFDRITFTLTQIQSTPSPEGSFSDELLGTNNLGIVRAPVTGDLANLQLEPSSVPLSSGSYEVLNIRIIDVVVTDLDADPGPYPPGSDCDAVVRTYPSVTPTPLSQFDERAFFTVDPESGSVMTLGFDIDALVVALQSSVSCDASCNCMTTGLTPITFANQAPSYLDIEFQ